MKIDAGRHDSARTPSSGFYVGYRKTMPPALAAFLRRRLFVLVGVLAVVGAALAALQHPLGPGRFEFGVVKTFAGIVAERPYPSLILKRPAADYDGTPQSRYYLVAPGKHGAQALVKGLDGHRVTLEGSIIARDGQTMIEIRPDSLRSTEERVAPGAPVPLGTFTLRGEIVDSKCYLGVMKPGNLKPHRACAIRCISGGCTPVLVVRDAAGNAAYLMLAGRDGRQVNAEVLAYVAEPLEVSGVVERLDNLLVLKAEPETYRLLTTSAE